MPKHRGGRTRHAPPELFPKEAVAPGWKVLHEVRRRPLRKALKPQPEQDAPDRTEKLHLALALGTEHRTAAAVESAEVEMAGPGPSPACTAPPTLAVGCITAPANTDRRGEQRRARDAQLRLHPCAASLTFILGSRRLIPPAQLAALDAEQALHGDLLFLECTEGSGVGFSHGGRAVAEKALGWFVHAANHTASPYVAKADDDTALSLPRLAADLEALSRDADAASMAYYGVHSYRLWDWEAAARRGGEPNAACGPHGDDGPPDETKTLRQLQALRRRGAKCASAAGPLPFADGSLEVLGRGALHAVFGAPRVRAFAAAAFAQAAPPYWTHEDAGLGALIYREAKEQSLPLTYVALRRWRQHRAWINWADRSTLLDGDAMWVHYTRDAARADYAAAAFGTALHLRSDGFACGACAEGWGWHEAPSPTTTCCSKRRARRRAPPPRAPPDAPPPVCGLGAHLASASAATAAVAAAAVEEEPRPLSVEAPRGSSVEEDAAPPPQRGARLHLAILTEPTEQDRRSRVRRLLASARAANASRSWSSASAAVPSSACFELDTLARARAPTHGFNLRAWLHYEAALHGDLSLTPLLPRGAWSAAPHGARQWLRRAAEHARQQAANNPAGGGGGGGGGGAARYYASTTAAVLEALPAAALELLLRGEPNDTPLPAARAALFKAPAAGALDWCYGHGWACCAAAARPPTCGVFVLPAAALRAA